MYLIYLQIFKNNYNLKIKIKVSNDYKLHRQSMNTYDKLTIPVIKVIIIVTDNFNTII